VTAPEAMKPVIPARTLRRAAQPYSSPFKNNLHFKINNNIIIINLKMYNLKI